MSKWQHRRSSCGIVLKDAQGNPMPGRRVHVELKNHEFLFGCGVFWSMDLLDPATPPHVKERLQKYWEAWSEIFNSARCPYIRAATSRAKA